MSVPIGEFEGEARDSGYRRIAGVDEVGRGPLAGPVVSAAVILPDDFSVRGIADSKRLSSKIRQRLYKEIYSHALTVGIGIVDPVEIDRINILQASLAAMAMAVKNLAPAPDCLLVDGRNPIGLDMTEKTIVGGDSRSVSIAAASIVAKVTRDRIMERYCTEYPEYGFSGHKGYPTKAHVAAIRDHGRCPIHRCSFKGVYGQRRSYYSISGGNA
ncbi:MAG: ribonuclease HII [Desulfobacteraceae bacterium]|nr:ribonuclease HII [Desulfobacteraceae bacterium]MCF8095801.1 ribonuclease HII [Desulfobacteraceae bacterium]